MSLFKKIFGVKEEPEYTKAVKEEKLDYRKDFDEFFDYLERTFSKDDTMVLRNFLKTHSDKLDIELHSGRYISVDSYIQSMTFEELIHTAIVNYYTFPNRRHFILVKLQRDIALGKIPEIMEKVRGFNMKPVNHTNRFHSNIMLMVEDYIMERNAHNTCAKTKEIPSHQKTYEESKRSMLPEEKFISDVTNEAVQAMDEKIVNEILPGTPEYDKIMEDIASGKLVPTKIHYPDSDNVQPYTGPIELNLNKVTKEFNEQFLAAHESEAEKLNPRSPGFIDSTIYKDSNIWAPVAEDGPEGEVKEMKASGAVQNYVEEAFELVPYPTISAIASTMKEGMEKYGYRNYMGIPKEEHVGRAIRHMYKYLSGDTSEEHLAHAITRLGFAVEMKHLEEEAGNHTLFPHLKDALKKDEPSSIIADYIVTNNPRGMVHNIANDSTAQVSDVTTKAKAQTMFDLGNDKSLEKLRNDSVEKLQGDRV